MEPLMIILQAFLLYGNLNYQKIDLKVRSTSQTAKNVLKIIVRGFLKSQ